MHFAPGGVRRIKDIYVNLGSFNQKKNLIQSFRAIHPCSIEIYESQTEDYISFCYL